MKRTLQDVFAWIREFWRCAVYRAWVSTLTLVILLMLLCLDQASELLFGVGELIKMGGSQQLSPGFRFAGWKAYAWFWLAGAVLAQTLGLVTRATQPSPSEQTSADDLPRDEGEEFEVPPQFVVIVALVLVHFAFVREFFDATASLVLITVALLAFLAFRVPPRWRWTRRITRVGLPLAAAILTYFALQYSSIGEARLAIGISIVTPAIATCLPWPRWKDRMWRRTLWAATAVLGGLVFWPWPSSASLTVGSLAVVLVFLSMAASLVACCVLLRRRYRIDAVVLVVALVCLLAWRHQERFGSEQLQSEQLQQVATTAPFEQLSRTKAEDGRRMPAGFAIHADGGGLRAALYTAQVLALADDMTCGEFGRYLLAASGVSGGALGVATWAVMRQEYLRKLEDDAWAACKRKRESSRADGGKTVPLPERPLTDLVYYTLVQDHLSPVLASMLATDWLPWGSATRGQALVQSWQDVALYTLTYDPLTDDEMQATPRPAFAAFATALKDANAGVKPAPLLLFTATDADSGEREMFSNATPAADDAYRQELQIGVAALHSARFPLISPAGAFYSSKKERWVRVVDGGYFDNSGAATLYEALKRAATDTLPEKLIVARIDGNAAKGAGKCDAVLNRWLDAQSGLNAAPAVENEDQGRNPKSLKAKRWSGIRTYVKARSAHAEEAASALSTLQLSGVVVDTTSVGTLRLDYEAGLEETCGPKVDPKVCEESKISACFNSKVARRAPLGWYVSRTAVPPMYWSAMFSASALVTQPDVGLVSDYSFYLPPP